MENESDALVLASDDCGKEGHNADMIRKALIIILSLACLATAVLWVVSYTLVNKSYERYGVEGYGFTLEKRFRGGNFGVIVQEGTVSILLATALGVSEGVQESGHSLVGFNGGRNVEGLEGDLDEVEVQGL